MKNRVIPAALGVLVLATGPAAAAPVAIFNGDDVNEIDGEHDGSAEASLDDLLQTVGSITSSMGATGDSDIAGQIVAGSLTTGAIAVGTQEEETTTDPNDTNAIFAAGAGHWIEYALDTTSNPLGYDIVSISTSSYWSSAERTVQAYTVQVRTVGGSFVDLITVSSPNVQDEVVIETTITDDSSPVLASGVDAVRFNFANNQEDWAAYREIDVEGTVTVPEPSTIALFGLGALCVGYRRRAG